MRFVFDRWEKAADGLDRWQKALLFEVAVENWRRRAPCPLPVARWLSSQDEVDRAVAEGLLIERDGGLWSRIVDEMAEQRRMAWALWREVRERIFRRDDYTCRYCGQRGGKIECDHIIPLSQGGTDDDENLTTACRSCNRRKHSKTPDQMGWK